MKELPLIACTLDGPAQAARAGEFRDLIARAAAISQIDGGVRIVVTRDDAEAALDLIAREKQCCAFWDFDVEDADDAVAIAMRGPAEAQPLLERLLGADRTG